jgi:phospholipid-binding lipoprotein MlaA
LQTAGACPVIVAVADAIIERRKKNPATTTMLRLPICLCLIAILLGGCATGPDKRDPLESMNRKVYAFNDTVDKAVLKPVTRVYVAVLPDLARTGVSNFFANLGMVVTTFNDALQLKGEQVPVDIMRFLVNTVFGIAGLIDVATELGIARNNEDFGQTLGYWGVGSGPYLVLPLLGPSSIRDGAALPVDFAVSPLSGMLDSERERWALLGLRVVDMRSQLLTVDAVLAQQLDPYSFVRDTYLQRREYLVRDGRPAPQPAEGSGAPRRKSLLELEEEEFGDEPVRPGGGEAVR